jgi:hypothetical protein
VIPLAFLLGTLLGWCTHLIYSDLRQRRRDRETSLAVVAFAEAEKRVESGIREMTR